MQVFELNYPGTWLDDTSISNDVEPLLYQLENSMADASVGLALFEEAQSKPMPEPGWKRRQPAERAIAEAMESQLPAPLDYFTRCDILEKANLQARRQEWAAGYVPENYERRLTFIHAHVVLYALDTIGRILNSLARISGIPAGVVAARDGYRTAIPDLVSVRDSAHHPEHRARGLDRDGKPLTLQPINNGMINAPNGNVLALNNLNGNRLGYTSNDGHYGEVEISAQTLTVAQTAIQQVLDALPWSGSRKTVPY